VCCWQILLFVLYQLLLDSEMTSGRQAVAISALLMIANVMIAIFIFFAGTKLKDHEKARLRKTLAPKALQSGGGNVEMTAVVLSKRGEADFELKVDPLPHHDEGEANFELKVNPLHLGKGDVEMAPAAPSNRGETPGRNDQVSAEEATEANPRGIGLAELPSMAAGTSRLPRRSSLPAVRTSAAFVSGGRRSVDDLALVHANQSDEGTI